MCHSTFKIPTIEPNQKHLILNSDLSWAEMWLAVLPSSVTFALFSAEIQMLPFAVCTLISCRGHLLHLLPIIFRTFYERGLWRLLFKAHQHAMSRHSSPGAIETKQTLYVAATHPQVIRRSSHWHHTLVCPLRFLYLLKNSKRVLLLV